MNSESMKPYGLALLDFFNGDESAKIVIYRDDGEQEELPINFFFRESSNFSPIEQTALNLCRGSILDIGAGAGPHSLELQNKGLSVCTIDISSEACEILKSRGINEVYCIDILDFKASPFDTLLILGRGIGMVGNLAGLDHFLENIHKLTKPNGQILLDSLDVSCTNNPKHLKYHELNRKKGLYLGEVRMRFEYKKRKGSFFNWLHVDPETLINHALKADWSCNIIVQEEDGTYLASLCPLEQK